MRPYLVHPEPGSINVPPDSEVTVCFEDPPEDWRDRVNIKIGGEWAVRSGEVARPYSTTRTLTKCGNLRWSIRRINGLKPGVHLIEAWCGDQSTVDQRIYVQGARVSIPRPDQPRARIPGGFFAIRKGGWIIRGEHIDVPDYLSGGVPTWGGRRCIGVYPNHSRILLESDDGVSSEPIPKFAFEGHIEWSASDTEGGWVVVSRTRKGVVVARPDSLHLWEIHPNSISVDTDFIHLDLDRQTAHLPTSYRPSGAERSLKSWYTIENPGPGNNRFSQNMHVWWTDGKMLAKHDPEPYRGAYNGILWTDEDIGDEFRSVEIVDNDLVIVNDTYLLNTRRPKIETL